MFIQWRDGEYSTENQDTRYNGPNLGPNIQICDTVKVLRF